MRFSSIDWQKYNLRTLAEKTRLSEEEVFGVFDSLAGIHIANGASVKSRQEIRSEVSKMIARLMEGAAMDWDEDDEDEDENPLPAKALPASMDDINTMVDGILGKLSVQWPGAN